MKAVGAVVLTLALAGAGVVAQKVDFSGNWTLDASKSDAAPGGGMGAGPGGGPSPGRPPSAGGPPGGGPGGGGMRGMMNVDALSVSQTAAELSVERRSGDRSTKAVYKLDGSESVNQNPRGQSKARAQWSGATLVLDVSQSMQTQRGDMQIQTKESWALAPDGKTLTITMTTSTPRGDVTRKMVFTKQV